MDETSMMEWRKKLEECESVSRSIAAAGRFRELEAPLRQMKTLLSAPLCKQEMPLDYYYFTMLYEQMNAGLYENIGKMQAMKEHFLLGKTAVEQLEKILPIKNAKPEEVSVRTKMIALNCSEFARTSSLIMEAIDTNVSWELAQLTARIYDWLWPDLSEKAALPAVEIHLKLASLSLLFKDDQAECERQLVITKEKYLELYNRTGNDAYREKAEQTVLRAESGTKISTEMLKSNPAIALVYRTACFTDSGTQALQHGQEERALFYYEQAVMAAERMLEIIKTPESWKVAVMAFLGAAYCLKKDFPERAKQLAERGISLCDLLKQHEQKEFTSKELVFMRKEFCKITGEKGGGILKRILGR